MKKSIAIATATIVLAFNSISYADNQSNVAPPNNQSNVAPNNQTNVAPSNQSAVIPPNNNQSIVVKTPTPVDQAYSLRKPTTGSSNQAPEGPPSVEAKLNKIPPVNKVPAENKVPKPNKVPIPNAIPAPNTIPQPNAIPNTQTIVNPN
jgi:hypothetical protein